MTPQEKLADTLDALHALERGGVVAIRSPRHLSRTHRERLVEGGSLREVLRVRHNPTRRLPQQHVAFLLGDGPAVLHTGDADPAADNFTALRDLPAVDVALVPFWYVLDASGRALMRQALAPRRIVAMHVPPSDAVDVARRLAASGMDAVLLTRPGMVVRDGVEVQQ